MEVAGRRAVLVAGAANDGLYLTPEAGTHSGAAPAVAIDLSGVLPTEVQYVGDMRDD
jgi:hypothetical protein